MTPQSEESPDGVVSTVKLPLERAEGYGQCRIEQRSGRPQYGEFSVPAGGARSDARVCIGYRRCSEFDEGDQPGQDYAVARAGGGYVVGVVADGVSRSFYGNLAAEYVATWLVEELWRRRADTPDEETMERLLKAAESAFADSVKDYRIPKELESFMVPILERKRPKGSQAVFAAFVLDVAKAELTLYQVGDISALVHDSGPEPELVESPAEGRWSSAGASALLLKKTSFRNVQGVVIKSDGASKEWGRALDRAVLDLERFSLMAKARAPLDDVSFVAVRLDAAPTAAASAQRAASDAQAEETSAPVGTPQPERPVQTGRTTQAVPEPVREDKQPHTWKEELPVSGGAGSGAAATAKAAANKVPTGGDVSARGEQEGGRTRVGAERKKAELPERRRAPWRDIRIFGAGVIVGLAAGAAVTLLTVFAVAPLRSSPAAAALGAQNPPVPQASPGAQTTPAPERAGISVEAKEAEQKVFLSEHKAPLPRLISDNPTTSPGEIIAHVSADDVGVERVVLVLGGKEAAAERGRAEGGRPSFFARLKGLAGPSPVTIRVLGRDGKALYEGQRMMRGRESKGPTNKDPFLGYYEISVRRGG